MPIQTAADSISNSQGSPFGFKNRIINGAMVIDQRNAGASVTPTTDAQFVLDRWKCRFNQASKYSVQQNAGSVTPAVGFSNYLGITSLSSFSPASSDFFNIQQPIEGFNWADLGWGTANAKTVTLSFQVYSSLTGLFGARLVNSASNRFYTFTYTVSSANTWTTISITIPGDTTGTWLTTTGTGVALAFDLGSGSTFDTSSPNTWGTSDAIRTSSCVRIVGTNGATLYITGVQLEKGTQATAFDYRDYGRELAMCQRYLWVYSGAYAYARGPVLNVGTTSTIWYFQYPTTMRAAPSLTLNNITSSTIEFANYTNGAAPTYSSAVFNESSIWGGCISLITTGSAFTIGGVGNWRWTGAPSANFTFSAEI